MAPLLTTTHARRLLIAGAIASGAALLVAGPYLGGQYQTLLLAQSFLFAAAAVTLDVVWGYTGIPELGHSIWFGAGALVVGMMTTTLSPSGDVIHAGGNLLFYLFAVCCGALAAGLFSVIVAWYSFSRNGTHFYIAVVTLALSTALQTLYIQIPWLTGGENGIFGYSIDWISITGWYYISAVVLVGFTFGMHIFVTSDFGLVMRAVRDNERRVRYLGYNVEHVKIIVYGFCGAMDGMIGALYSTMVGAVSAPLFGFQFATEMMIWVAVGGRSTIFGPVISTIVLALIGSQLNRSFPSQWGLFVGALFVAVMVFAPDGVLPPLVRRFRRGFIGSQPSRRTDRVFVVEHYQPPWRRDSQEVISLRGVRFSFGKLNVLRGVDLDIPRGELLCIVGPNGAGKSTLIEVISDGFRNIGGFVNFNLGNEARHLRHAPDQIANKGIVRKFQIPSLFKSLTVAEHILLSSWNGRLPSFWRRTREVRAPVSVIKIIQATGLASRENATALSLAHGLKQGLEIAMAVSTRPQVLFLDEPTAGLTSNERGVIGDILRDLVASGLTVVLIEHDLDFVRRVADRIAVLHDGRVIECGPPHLIADSKVVREAYLGSYSVDEAPST